MSDAAFNAKLHAASELRRMLARQKELDPASMEYGMLMSNLEVLSHETDMFDDIESFLYMVDHHIERIEIAPGGKEIVEDEADPAPAPAKEPDPEPAPPADPGKTYEMSEVRAALVAARKNGTNVTELLKEFGVENFSAFPAGRYGELMQRLGAA